ncbi:unnamed protein product [Lymnaea stagnalis]|uniref:Single-stranded DNA-binding protein, mitochondrial n=1 Tax=Lymnaea stagnalis TaxID=6523 RepID=A0AAV2IME9_LYMST
MLRVLQKRLAGSLTAQCSRLMATGSASIAENNQEEENLTGLRRPERGLNKVTLIGRVGRDPDHRGSEEHPALIFPLATNFTYKKANGEAVTKTDWHRICVFRPGLRDNVANRIVKGDRILVEGAISYQKFTDRDQREVNVTSIIADDIMFLAKRQNQENREEIDE